MPQSSCSPKMTSIGGQAVLEGIMMRGPIESALSVRRPDGTIVTETWKTNKKPLPWYKKTPFIRGVFQFVDTLLIGYKTLMRSAELSGSLEEEQPSKFGQWLEKKFGDKVTAILGTLVSLLAVCLALFLFMFLPSFFTKWMGTFVPLNGWLSVIEGSIKILIFVAYVFFCSRLKEIHRVFQYHGGEHKCIFCYEAGLPLTVENVRKQKRFHPRCGTSFILIVLILGILVSSIVTWDSLLLRVLLKVVTLPIVCSVSYEIIKLAGRCRNLFTRAISAPGMWLQRLTTQEPDDRQIEVAIAALNTVIPEDPNLDSL